MSYINLQLYASVGVLVMALLAMVVAQSTGGCPDVFDDTGQTNEPYVQFNGEDVSDGGTLSSCPTRTRCTFRCTATSDFSPTLYINGVCYPVTKVSKEFKGAVVDLESHPYYPFTFDCDVVTHFRCVYSESSYSHEYTLEGNSVENCNETPTSMAGGTIASTSSPSPTHETEPSPTTGAGGDQGAGPHNGIATEVGSFIAAAVAVLIFVAVLTTIILCIVRRRNRNRNSTSNDPQVPPDLVLETAINISDVPDDSSATMVATGNTTPVQFHTAGEDVPDDTSSSASGVPGNLTSVGRNIGDGQEEVDPPFPTVPENEAGVSQLVTGRKVSHMAQKEAQSSDPE